jgi:menaquinone-dependent protoporphyrinogen oxidase
MKCPASGKPSLLTFYSLPEKRFNQFYKYTASKIERWVKKLTIALIVYGTRYGATASTAAFIADLLEKESFEVKVVNLKEQKNVDFAPYDLIIVGTGLQFGRWTGEVEDYIKRNLPALSQKKVAFFASSMKTVLEREGKTGALETDRKMELDNKFAKLDFTPLSVGFFGGVIDFNKMNPITRKMSGSMKKRLEKAGFKENAGVYDLRNLDEIETWAKELAKRI